MAVAFLGVVPFYKREETFQQARKPDISTHSMPTASGSGYGRQNTSARHHDEAAAILQVGGRMCGRLSQYRGIHDFVETLSLPEAWRNNVGDQPLGRYNVAPTTPVAVLRVDDAGPRADLVRWGWRPHWATDRAAPINA
ncbi:SOS response-associated peptidase family protein, partial [Pseudomonas sp.]|uniref:SOS response-associated peptidase family protein n=1 Tax=Pseudomonas sp. TaxID=306 RepID=UPI0031D738CF